MTDVGSASVELALLIPVVVLLLAVVAEVAATAQVQVLAVHASREAARTAAVSPDIAEAVVAAQEALPAVVAASAAVSIERTKGLGQPVRATVRIPHRLFRYLAGIPIELRWTTTMRSER